MGIQELPVWIDTPEFTEKMREFARNTDMKEMERLMTPTVKEDPLNIQVGGGHYKNMKIQPTQYCEANRLGHCESSVIKYISRWRTKGGIKDLEKAKHFIDLLIEMEQMYHGWDPKTNSWGKDTTPIEQHTST